MSYKSVYTLSEIRYLWKSRGNKNYEMRKLNASGNLIHSITFEDIRNRREVSGKFVVSPREGEAYHWPRLQHENLAPLLDIVSINENVSIYITTASRRSLNYVINEVSFLRSLACFERKKSYAEDILWALDYLHDKHLSLMNLSDENIFINESDKAIITDFSCLMLAERATKDCVSVPTIYRAPELEILAFSENFDAIKAEIWACGILMLHIFTGNLVLTTFTAAKEKMLEFVEDLDVGVLIMANIGSSIFPNALTGFKNFLNLYFCFEPSSRASAKVAAIDPFLQRNTYNPAKNFEIHSPVIEKMSNKLPLTDPAAIGLESSVGKNEIATGTSSDISIFTPVNNPILNREKIKRRWPFNKFINVQSIPSSNPTNKIFNTKCIRNKNTSEKKSQVHKIKRKQIPVLQTVSDVVEMTVLKADPGPNLSNSEILSMCAPEPVKCERKEKYNMMNRITATLQRNIFPNDTNLKEREKSPPETGVFYIENPCYDAFRGNSKDIRKCIKYNSIFSTDNPNEEFQHSFSDKIQSNTKVEQLNSTYATNEFERSERPKINTDLKMDSFKLRIFPSKSYPCNSRSSACWDTNTRHSISVGGIQRINTTESNASKSLVFDTDIIHADNRDILNLTWKRFSYGNDENSAGEGDKMHNIFEHLIFSSVKSGQPENKIPEVCSAVVVKDNKLDDNSDIQIVENSLTTEVNDVYKKAFDIEGGEANSRYLNGDFTNCNASLTDRETTNNKILVNNEGTYSSTTSIPEELTSNETDSPGKLHNESPDNINQHESNLNSDYFSPKFTLDRASSLKKFYNEHIEGNLLVSITETSHSSENDKSPQKSIEQVDVCDTRSSQRQQLHFLNPFRNEYEWNTETRQAGDIELTNLNLSKGEFNQDDSMSSKVSIFQDHIGVFERNLSSFTEIPLSPKCCDEIVETLTRKERKSRKRSWFRLLCPGCKSYRRNK